MTRQKYTIFYNSKTYNPYKRYFQNQNRCARFVHMDGKIEDVLDKIRELKSTGNVENDSFEVSEWGTRIKINLD